MFGILNNLLFLNYFIDQINYFYKRKWQNKESMKKYFLIYFFLVNVINGYSQRAEKLFEQGQESYNKGEYAKAITELTASIEKDNNPSVYAWRASAYLELKEYQKALQDYDYAISMKTNAPAWFYSERGKTKYSLKDYEGAIKDHNIAIDLEKKGLYYFRRGQAYYNSKLFNEALLDFNKARELNYDDSKSSWKLYTLWALQDYENIIPEAKRLIGEEPSEQCYYYRGYSQNMLNRKIEAKNDARNLILLYPNSHLGQLLDGIIYMSERNYDLAIKSFEKSLEKKPESSTTNFNLSRCYYYKSEYDKALSYIDKAIVTDSSSANLFFKGRIFYFGLQNSAEANKLFNIVLEKNKMLKNSWHTNALLYLGREDEAIAMQKQIAEETQKADEFLALATYYSFLDREAEAIENIEKIILLGYKNYSEMLGYTDLDNIKFKKSFRDLFAKYDIPYDLDNITLVQVYVKSAVNKWQKRGKYEKSNDYITRVSEANRKKYIEEATKEAIQYVGRFKIDPKIANLEYNPDIETFKIALTGGQDIIVKVPVSEAQAFDSNVGNLEVNPVFALNSDNNFIIEKISIRNPANEKVYSGSSNLTSTFTSAKLSLDFAPIQTYIDKYKVKEDLQSKKQPDIRKVSAIDTNIPLTTRKKTKTFALVIGNEDYSTFQPDLNSEVNVDYAVNDAKVFKEYLNKTIGIPNENIFLYTNATAGQMKQAISKMEKLAKAYNGDAELIFFFAGHGLPDEVSHESYIMPVDISGNTIQYAIKLGDVYQQLSANPTKRILVFLDACFSGGARNEGLVTLRGVKVRPKEEYIRENMVVYASSSGTQASMGFDEEQHGLFTYFLLKKLNETKGNVSIDELGKYLETEVNRKSILLKNRDQKPQMKISPTADNTLLSKKISE